MSGQVHKIQKHDTTMRYLSDYTNIIEWYAECPFFDKQFLLKNRTRKNTDNITGDDGKIPKKEMGKFETEIRKYL